MTATPAIVCTLIFLIGASAPALAMDPNEPQVASFIDTMVAKHGFKRAELREELGKANITQAIVDAISKPAEKTLTWGEYRDIFLTPERIRAGVAFWRDNEQTLASVSVTTGVPVEIVVGIVGVETYFGRITGTYRVIDALATLAFDYPPRSSFFKRELEQYLLLVREEGMAVTDATGSYAGAMGRPQFMPSSYRAYAVDATGDGKRDIWNNWADAAGSVANYLLKHDWVAGEEIAAQATLGKRWHGPLPKNILAAKSSVGALSARDVEFATRQPAAAKAELLTLDGKSGDEYWVGFHNFFVITRYNRSILYALAVYQLGEAIAAEVQRSAN